MAEMENARNLLHDLLEQGKKNGKLAMKEITRVFDEMELDPDQQDRFFEALEKAGIDVAVEEEDFLIENQPLDDVEGDFPGSVEEIPEEELVDTSASAEVSTSSSSGI